MSICLFFVNSCLKLFNLNPIDIKEVYDEKIKPIIKYSKCGRTSYKFQIQNIELSHDFFWNDLNGFETPLYYILDCLTPITLYVSFVSLVFASADRFIALTFPFKYRKINSNKVAKIVSVFVWVLSIIINTVTSKLDDVKNYSWLLQPNVETGLFFEGNTTLYNNETNSLNRNITSVILIVLFISLLTLNFLTVFSLYKSYKRSKLLNRKNKKGVSLEKQMSLILIFMVFAFTASSFPTIYKHVNVYLVDIDFKDYIFFKGNSFLISVTFLATNSVWNFIIYNILNKKFRLAFVSIFCKKHNSNLLKVKDVKNIK